MSNQNTDLANLTSMTEPARSLLALTLRHVQESYDQASSTHIYFCLAVGKFGVRGIGAFRDEAFTDFRHNLEELLSKATLAEIKSWTQKVEQSKSQVRQPVQEEQPTSDLRIQIGVVTSKSAHTAIKGKAQAAGKSVNDFVLEIFYSSFADLKKAGFDRPAEIRKLIAECGQKPPSEPEQWVVRFPVRERSKLAVFANELSFKPPQVLRYLIESHLSQETQSVSSSEKKLARR